MLIKIQKLLLFFVLFVSSINFTSAKEIFVDSFDDKTNSWNYNTGNGQIILNQGILSLTSHAYYFPYIEGDFSKYLIDATNIKIRFMFDNAGGMGDGIGIGFTGTGQINYFQFGIWRDTDNGAFFYYHDFNNAESNYCSDFSNVNDVVGREYKKNIFLDNIWNELEIQKNGTGYKVFINRADNPDPIFITQQNQCIPRSIWFGNKMAGGSYDWTSLHLDKLIIEGENNIKNKIIIIPGLGASWNTEGMLLPIDGVKREWKMAPFVNNYDSLVKAFEDKGMVRDVDYFVWNYDWRKSIGNIVADFDDYVGDLGLSGESRINIVGHSLGGVIGRVWAQEHNNEKLGKIITLGSPNFGSIDAYEIWNGAKISNNFGMAKIGLNVLLQLKKRIGETKLDVIHSYTPIFGDLLPVFNFVKKNGTSVPYSELFYKNNYLEDKNLQVSSIFEKLDSIAGNGFESKEFLNIGQRAIYDKVLGYWQDGSVLGFTNTSESDGTVLKKSAVFGDDTSYSLNSKHANLSNSYIGGVFSLLDLGATINPISEYIETEKFIFFIGSPAYLSVTCDDGLERVSDEMGFVVVDKLNLNSCRVSVIGTGSGIYHLVLGSSDNENGWLSFEDSINNLEVKTVEYDVKKGSLVLNEINMDYLYEQLASDIIDLQNFYPNNSDLVKVLGFVNGKKINDAMDSFFKFRKSKKDYIKTAMILDEIELILEIENKNISLQEVNRVNKKFISDKSLVDRIARLNKTINKDPGEFGANSYKQMDEKMLNSKISVKLGKLGDSYVDSILGSKLAYEVW